MEMVSDELDIPDSIKPPPSFGQPLKPGNVSFNGMILALKRP